MLAYIIGIVLFALGICVSVALHEAGHMVTAKAFGMKVRRYFVENALGWSTVLIYLFAAVGSGYFLMARTSRLSHP